MSICDPNSKGSSSLERNEGDLQKTLNNTMHIIYQKLIIKHSRLKKLSLWGCSGLDVRFSNLMSLLCFLDIVSRLGTKHMEV